MPPEAVSPGVGDELTHAETGERVKIVSGRGPDLIVTPLDVFGSPRKLDYAELADWGVTPPADTVPLHIREASGWARLARDERVNAVLLGIADGTIGEDGEVTPDEAGLGELAWARLREAVARLRRPPRQLTPEEVLSRHADRH